MQTAAAQININHIPVIPLQRGKRLFEQLLFEVEALPTLKVEQAGRNPILIEARNNFLFYRYYYKARIKRMLYQDVLKELSTETWLSETRIKEVIQDNSEAILNIKKEAPTVKQLKQMFNHIIWE